MLWERRNYRLVYLYTYIIYMYKNRVLRGKGEEREGEDISGAGEAFWTGV